MPQGSILGLILFNIYLCDMCFKIDNIDIASCAVNHTPYCVGKKQCNLELKLQKASAIHFAWFHENCVKAN